MYMYTTCMYTYMYTAYNTVHVHVLNIKTSLMEHSWVVIFSPLALDQLHVDALAIRPNHQKFIKQYLYTSHKIFSWKKSLCLSEDRARWATTPPFDHVTCDDIITCTHIHHTMSTHSLSLSLSLSHTHNQQGYIHVLR